MSGADHEDRLLDVLLDEELGERFAPDLTGRVLAAAGFGSPWPRWAAAASLSAAAAALLALAVTLWPSAPVYPQPTAQGAYLTHDGQPVRRGSVLSTRVEPASIVLGGYGEVEIAPHSAVRVEGREKDEAIRLEAGAVTCKVEKNVGRFSVRTDLGTVWVQGTEFSVQFIEESQAQEGDPDMRSKHLLVRVLTGAVLVTGALGQQRVEAGEEHRISNGVFTGVVTAKGEGWIVVRPEKHDAPVKMMPRWIGGEGGGLDRKMLRNIALIPVGSTVKVKMEHDERPRIVAVRVLKVPKEGEHAKEREGHREAKQREHHPEKGDREHPEKQEPKARREHDEDPDLDALEKELRRLEEREGKDREMKRREGEAPRKGDREGDFKERGERDREHPEAKAREKEHREGGDIAHLKARVRELEQKLEEQIKINKLLRKELGLD